MLNLGDRVETDVVITGFDGDSDGVVRKAWALFGKGNCEMFRNALAFHGFKPEPLGRTFILRLPSKPTGSADWNRIARMNNIAG